MKVQHLQKLPQETACPGRKPLQEPACPVAERAHTRFYSTRPPADKYSAQGDPEEGHGHGLSLQVGKAAGRCTTVLPAAGRSRRCITTWRALVKAKQTVRNAGAVLRSYKSINAASSRYTAPLLARAEVTTTGSGDGLGRIQSRSAAEAPWRLHPADQPAFTFDVHCLDRFPSPRHGVWGEVLQVQTSKSHLA